MTQTRPYDSPAFRDYLALFQKYGGTAEGYLADHYWRFVVTLNELKSDWPRDGGRVLDIGGHWLHQSVMWSQAGFDVTAVELPGVFANPNIQRIAHAMGITLVPCANLERPEELRQIPDDSMDVVLFTEILEHITFNPIGFWREVYRVLAPGGRILVTTPNYYSWRGRAWQVLRFARGYGGGISVAEVLTTHTYGHHWREYSRKEVLEYFRLLSPDFVPIKARLMPTYMRSQVPWKNAIQWLLDRLPLLRPNLHIEIGLPKKTRGIVISPGW